MSSTPPFAAKSESDTTRPAPAERVRLPSNAEPTRTLPLAEEETGKAAAAAQAESASRRESGEGGILRALCARWESGEGGTLRALCTRRE